MWDVIIPAVASLVGGAIAGEGAKQSGDATADASREANALNKNIYLDQRGLSKPGYLTGGAATNKLANIFGIAPQDYAAAFNGGSSGSVSGFGNPNSQSDQWSAYLAANQDVMNYWKGNAKLRQMYPNANDFAAYHYANFGQQEGRALPSTGGSDKSTMPVGGAEQVSTNGNALANPLAEFNASPYAKLAYDGWAGIDGVGGEARALEGNWAARGKVGSGAAVAARKMAETKNASGAFGDYTNALRSLAGINQTAGSQIGSAAGQYGANSSANIMAAGQARGNALAGAYQGYANGIAGAAGYAANYLKGSGTPSYGQPGYVDPSRAAYPGQY